MNPIFIIMLVFQIIISTYGITSQLERVGVKLDKIIVVLDKDRRTTLVPMEYTE